MSYTKRYIEELQAKGENPLDINDDVVDAEYMDCLRSKGITIRKDDSVMKVTKEKEVKPTKVKE